MLAHNLNNQSSDTVVPLRKWIQDEAKKQAAASLEACSEHENCKKERILRKTTVAYGIAELFRHFRSTTPSTGSEAIHFSIDNFAVRHSDEAASNPNNIKGMNMILPQLSMDIIEPSFLRDSFSDGVKQDQMGRYLEAEFPTLTENANVAATPVSQSEEDSRCRSLGLILYELFSHISPSCAHGYHLGGKKSFTEEKSSESELGSYDASQEPPPKKTKMLGCLADGSEVLISPRKQTMGQEKLHAEDKQKLCVHLFELRFPSTICLLVQNLLECGEENRPDDAYDSLDVVCKDLRLLLLDPIRFLFDCKPTSKNGNVQLSLRKHKLYGRENEVSLITDAFCRVSAGKSEAFFIGGFSGSGKSRLVNSLTNQVDISDGYVITHKFDHMSKERPLWEVISVFNELCILIMERRTQQDLNAMANSINDVFRADFSLLARLLPYIDALAPNFTSKEVKKESGGKMNFQSICFILQRFLRVVSSKSHPVMLFLDDLQWCDKSALMLIEGILSDSKCSSCVFFVGSYRSNEVEDDHEIFRLIDRLGSNDVPTTTLSLEGLNSEDLNTMMSDAMCMFPRLCKPFSDIVFEKTKGNPFFALEFLSSLVERGLLEYSACKRKWIWDERRICSMDVTGNVLYLVSSKMNGLSEDIQLALKVAACFGIKVKESIIGHLNTIQDFSNVQIGIEHAVNEGLMAKVGTSDFKFVHDKVREAAYSLIPDTEKKEFHYTLGMSLHSVNEGSNMDDIIFSIADQINHGMKGSPEQSPELQVKVAKINQKAGIKAVDCSDYKTASSYLSNTLSLLPTNHWKTHYDLSLRSHFLLAKSAYSCGDIEKAYAVLQEILRQAHSLSDKLDAYHLVVVILYGREAEEEAYMTTHDVLSQLGESIPDVFGKKETKAMVGATSKMLNDVSEESLLQMKEMDTKQQYLLKFYIIMTMISFFAKTGMVPFFTCRMVQLSMKHGICIYSLTGFVQYAAMVCSHNMLSDNIRQACRIGKLAMTVLKRFDSSTDQVARLFSIYYGFVALYSEQAQSVVDNLCKGFECGIATGDTSAGSVCAIMHVRTSLIAGMNLHTILERIDYYLDIMFKHGNQSAKTHLLLYRDTISILMGKECRNSSEVQDDTTKFLAEALYYHKAMRAYWSGHSERSHYFVEKLFQGINNSGGRHQRRFFLLYYGLNSFKVMKQTSSQKLKAVPRDVLKALKVAACYSEGNFRSKVHLLEAEIFSREGSNEEARASYDASIEYARSSKFVHEQGLACELAGLHCRKVGDNMSAWSFFNQAKQCYCEWGSQMKVQNITHQLEQIGV